MDSTRLTILAAQILALLVLVLLNGFFVAAEFALVKIRDTQLLPLIRKGHRRARVAQHVIRHLDRYLSGAQLGITLASLGLGWIGHPIFAHLLEPAMSWLGVQSENTRHTIAFMVGFSTITFLHITAGEQAPKWLAIQKPLQTSLWVALPLNWFYKLTYPLIWMLNESSLWILRRVGIEPGSESELVHSEEELRLILAGPRKAGGDLGRNIVLNAFDLRRRIARDVMRPRHEIVCLDTEGSIAECLNVAEKSRFSRLPLCESGNLDRTLGVVHIKDLYAMRLRAKTGADLAPVARKLIYVPETARLEKVLRLFLERQLHFAIIIDEFGGTVGMITLENILEELVGPIQDEFDQEKPLAVRLDENTWEVLGALPVHDLAEIVGESIPEQEAVATTSGWVTFKLSGFPKKGDAVTIGNFELSVEEMDGPRVAMLRLRRTKMEPALPE
jgi:CBS domain containing-hemolysin-like protein